jgi:hypothetical protein
MGTGELDAAAPLVRMVVERTWCRSKEYLMGFLFLTLVFLILLAVAAAAAEDAERRRRLRLRGFRIADRPRVVRNRVSRYVVSMPSKTQRKRGIR